MTKIFPNNNDLYERYKSLKDAEPYKHKREKFLANFNRRPWKRNNLRNCDLTDPNFGSFRSKVVAAMNVLVGVMTERNSWFKVIPKYAPSGLVGAYSESISAAFHRFFIRPMEDRVYKDTLTAYDVVMYGRSIEHWPSKGCFESVNVPVERVFPDSNANMLPKSWAYCFMEVDFTIAELYSIRDGKKVQDHENFNRAYLDEILGNPDNYSSLKKNSEIYKDRSGEIPEASKDDIITMVYAYVKEDFEHENKVSLYVFPADNKVWKRATGNSHEKIDTVKCLIEKQNYCECISNHIAVRSDGVLRKYWKFSSIADQIYLATQVHDKTMALALRAARRGIILYVSGSSPEAVKKLLRQTDAEIQALTEELTFQSPQQQSGALRDLVEASRQIMIDTDNQQASTQAPGSQNVKGYPITKAEAEIRESKQSEAQSLSIKVFMNVELPMYRELYRRGVTGGSSEYKKAREAFKMEMERLSIPEEYWDPENVYMVPSYMNGGQSSRVQYAQMLFGVLGISPTNPGQEKAQRELVGAIVGVEAVDDYIQAKEKENPIVIKVGSENEDLDSPYANPANLQVLPSDKHLQEIPIHIADYQVKLQTAGEIIKRGIAEPLPLRKIIMLQLAEDLILAQQNKGAHIQAHIKAASSSEENMNVLKPYLDQLTELQRAQASMAGNIQKLNDDLDQELATSDMNSEALRHTRAMNQEAERHTQSMNNLKTVNQIEKTQASEEGMARKAEQEMTKNAINQAAKEEAAQQQLTHQEKLNDLEQRNKSIKAAAPKE